jgi:hypothetical protein
MRHRLLLLLLTGLSLCPFAVLRAPAQGCVCVRPTNPGNLNQAFLEPGEWQVGAGYRWLYSNRHFSGSNEEKDRQREGSEVINDVHYFDFSLTYALTRQLTASLTIPYASADRSQVVRSNDTARTILERFHTGSSGIGDVRVVANYSFFDPERAPKGNIALGLGVKLPTGEKDAVDSFRVFDAGTGTIGNAKRTVDQSIQPGDGGWGVILDFLAYRQVLPRLTAFANGTYIMTPQETSGVPTFRSRPQEAIMSIADQYTGRAGFSYDVLPKQGLSLSLSGRIEGVPVRDLAGGSDGFRRPGFALSIEPGIAWRFKKATIGVSAPVMVYANRERSVPDIQASNASGTYRHGDAAFASYLIQANFTYRF